MSIGKSIAPDLVGALICIVGAFAQICIGRRLRINRWLNDFLAFVLVFIYFCDEENMIPAVRRLLPVDYRTAQIPAAMELWSLCLFFTLLLLFLRDSISPVNPVPPIDAGRRHFLTASTTALCVATPAAFFATGIIIRKEFQVKELDISFPNLPKDLQGLRLLQLSDIHLGPFFTPADLRRIVDASNSLRADLVFITGDLITDRWDPLDVCIAELSRLRCSSGLWGCMGNHELYAKVQDYTERKARSAGINFLRQASTSLRFGNNRMNIVGVDYQPKADPYLVNVEELRSPDSFNVLLSHNPDVFPVAARQGFDLTLSGHTHGGQVNFEILGQNLNVADFFTPYTKGFYKQANSSIYVNSGLGTIGLPVRLGVPPEITVIRLCSS